MEVSVCVCVCIWLRAETERERKRKITKFMLIFTTKIGFDKLAGASDMRAPSVTVICSI